MATSSSAWASTSITTARWIAGRRPGDRLASSPFVGARLSAPSSAAALAAILLIAGCQDSSSLIRGDDAGVSGRDSGGGRDGGSGDARVGADAGPPPGTRIADLPAELVAVPPGGEEVLYIRAGTLMRVKPDGRQPESLGLRPAIGYGPTPNLWLFSDVDGDGSIGALDVYPPGGPPRTLRLDARAATDVFASDEDGAIALVAADVRVTGNVQSSTRSASLASVEPNGDLRVLLRGLTLGRWDMRTRQHVCAPEIEVMSPSRALAIVCPTPGDATRVLVAIDLVSGSTRTVARDVVPFLRASADRTFAIYADRSLAFFGTSATGDRVLPLVERRRITSFGFLGGGRVAYTTASKDLLVMAWPDLVPSPIVAQGAEAIEAISPAGDWVMFRNTRDPSGLRDLYLVGTETGTTAAPLVLSAEPDAYPGDDAFSDDGVWAQWFAHADANFIGDVMVRPTAGGDARRVAQRGWIVKNYADTARVMVLANARFSGDGRRLVADLVLASRTGDSADELLVTGLDTSAFEPFAEGDRVAFRVSDGAFPGLWVRALR